VSPEEHLAAGHLYGIACLPRGADCVCGTFFSSVADDSGVSSRNFAGFYLPVGSLGKVYPLTGFPFSEPEVGSNWSVELDDWLADLADSSSNR
jgi:hypothetical protein